MKVLNENHVLVAKKLKIKDLAKELKYICELETQLVGLSKIYKKQAWKMEGKREMFEEIEDFSSITSSPSQDQDNINILIKLYESQKASYNYDQEKNEREIAKLEGKIEAAKELLTFFDNQDIKEIEKRKKYWEDSMSQLTVKKIGIVEKIALWLNQIKSVIH